ncbi:MAG TPA: hypothetical protein VI565_12075, partial [Burkholderiales bacterium]|nr:hypothetical protein [Burkholderiales bacterium]
APGTSWIFGPDWDDRADVSIYTRTYHSRPMGPSCGANNVDQPQQIDTHEDPDWAGEYWLHFRPWCTPHPTDAGQQAIADAVTPKLLSPFAT